ncbi:hypothetical protein ACNSO7_01975, partial [Yersinia enterocolitica]|uniref:hypothetical protein n=1 Tax=Yersinia enterocolitica TaxID=630 RepID=UPI003AB73E59
VIPSIKVAVGWAVEGESVVWLCIGSAIGNLSYISVILQAACALAALNNPNHLQHSKLIGINEPL